MKIYDSCDGKVLKEIEYSLDTIAPLAYVIYYIFMTYDNGTPGFTNDQHFIQIRQIDFSNGDIYTRRTDVNPLINLFNWIAILNGYPNVSKTGEEGRLIGLALIKSNKAVYYPNIINAKHFSKWKYKNKKLKIVF